VFSERRINFYVFFHRTFHNQPRDSTLLHAAYQPTILTYMRFLSMVLRAGVQLHA
jgi:hypothetical protein